jgi:hypothetical protein
MIKLCALEFVPFGVATVMGALVAPAGTVVWMFVAVELAMEAATDPKATLVTPVKFEPTIETGVPTTPALGLKSAICGALGFDVVNVPITPPALILHVPAAVTVAPLDEVDDVFRYRM